MREVLPAVHLIKLGAVNAYLIKDEEPVLVDTGYPGSADKILEYARRIDLQPSDIKHILLTHLHTDHSGSAAVLRQRCGARVYAHASDAALLRRGQAFRDKAEIAPGLVNRLVYNLLIKKTIREVEPVEVDDILQPGQVLDIPLRPEIIHLPGHSAGQVGLLLPLHGGILLAADAVGNIAGLGLAPFYEDLGQGYRDLDTILQQDFRHLAFGHGRPILREARKRFIHKFG